MKVAANKLISIVIVTAMVITSLMAVSGSADGVAAEGLEITSLPSGFSESENLQIAKNIVYGDGCDVELSMTSGDTFSYTVTTNITSSISISGTAAEWLSVTGNRISGIPTESGTYALNITATANTSGIIQTAVQTVSLIVFDRLMMRTGDTFSYAVITNITSSISISGTAAEWLSVTGNRISGIPTESGTYALDITATANTSGIIQTASQSVSIQVCERVTVSEPTSSVSVSVGTSSGTVVASFSEGTQWTGPKATTVTCNTGNSSLFTWDESSETLKLARSVTASDVGVYNITWIVSYNPSGYEEADEQTHVLTVSVYSDLAITSESDYSTYVGNGSESFTVTTNHDSDNSSISTVAAVPTSLVAYVTVSDRTVTYNFDSYTTKSNVTYDTVSFTLTVTGNLGSVEYTPVTQTVTIRIYPTLEFVNLPTVGKNVTVTGVTDDNLTLILTTDISGAEDIKVYWGDGTYTCIEPVAGTLTGYVAKHHYESEGDYNITLIASNDVGDQRTYILYDAYAGGFSAFDGNAPRTDFFDGHGNLWFVALIVGLTSVSVYAIGYRNEYLLLITFMSAALAVILYITGASL